MEEFEDWIKHAKEYAVDRRLKREGDQVVGREIDLNDILDDVSTRDGSMKTCRHAIVLASAGMGKTTLLRWIAQYGIQGTLKKLEGKLIVMPDFRTLPTDKKLHPSQALLGTMFKDQDSERMKQRYQWMLEYPDKVVFLIDSLDTLAFDFDTERPRIGHNTEALPEDILHNLLSRDLFPKSNIISTSREFKVRNMHPNVRPDRCLLIDGLKEESVQDLIGEFLGEEKGEEVKHHIKTECPDVGPLLVMPVFLVFGMIGFMASGFIPNTMSGILIKYYVSLIFSNHAQVKNIRVALVRLMPMAFDGILKGQVLFSLEHFNSFGIDPQEVTDLGILIPFSTGNYLFSKLMQVDGFYLYFNHQTLQECLAALHILSLDLTKYKNLINTNLFKPNFIIVRRILCGTLLNPQVLEATKELMHIPDIDRKKSILLESLRTELEQQHQQLLQDNTNKTCREKLLEVFIDLNEAKSGATELIQSSVKEIDLYDVSLSLNDIQSVGNVMKQCKYLQEVILARCNLNDKKMEILARTLNQSDLKFRELHVSYNKGLGPDGFHHLGKLIRQHEVQVLHARDCDIRSGEIKELSSGLGGAKFRELNVSGNIGLGPDGFCHLGKLIRQHEVQVLVANNCNMRYGGVKELSSGLGGAKVNVLDLEDVYEPRYIQHLLDLLCHVEEKLNLTQWKINEDEQQQLQNRLNEIGSPSLTIVLGEWDQNKVLLKAFTADTASACVSRSGSTLKVGGSHVEFPPNTFMKESQIDTISAMGDNSIPQQYFPVSRTLHCKSSEKMIKNTRAKIRIPIWVSTEDRNVILKVLSKKNGAGEEWKEMKSIPLYQVEGRMIEFKVNEFGWFTAAVDQLKTSQQETDSQSESTFDLLTFYGKVELKFDHQGNFEVKFRHVDVDITKGSIEEAKSITLFNNEKLFKGDKIRLNLTCTPQFEHRDESREFIVDRAFLRGTLNLFNTMALRPLPESSDVIMISYKILQCDSTRKVGEVRIILPEKPDVGKLKKIRSEIEDTMEDLLLRVEKITDNLQPETVFETVRESAEEYVNRIKAAFKKLSKQKSTKTKNITPEGGSVELHGCEIGFPIRAVNKKTDVKISLENKENNFPKSLTPISPILGCKPSTFNVPVSIKLTAWFSAKYGKKIRVYILCQSGPNAEWKTIQETVLQGRTNVIEYEVSHFCKHVAAVALEDEANGEYHLINDVWMHKDYALIVSVFCKGKQAHDVSCIHLKPEHKRIISMPRNLLASIGEIITVAVHCNSPRGLRITNEDNEKLEITKKMLKTTPHLMHFWPDPHPEKLNHNERYHVSYHVKLVNSQMEPIEGGFNSPLYFRWPIAPNESAGQSSQSQQNASRQTVIEHLHAEHAYVAGQGNRHVHQQQHVAQPLQMIEGNHESTNQPDAGAP